ncbi:sulfite exporter TauE/SafE family protein [Adonisia turfae]|nr:sulfite exporter TauE/SafE family protein [Adonisia turfae]
MKISPNTLVSKGAVVKRQSLKVKHRSLKGIFCLMQSKSVILTSLLSISVVWLTWLLVLTPKDAISNFVAHWEIALTMLFGSLVAGGTSMGGGAVAFPVLTKLLEISPYQAKVFSLAIQAVGMGSASLTIIAMGTPLPWRLIYFASLGGIPGIWLGSAILAPVLPPDVIRISFTMMLSSFWVIFQAFGPTQKAHNLVVRSWDQQVKIIIFIAGLLGGVFSGLMGTGMDIYLFSVMVLLFNLCEKISTPTSVVLMAINAIVGFFLHQFVIGDFVEPIPSYWLAAVPIVVVGAPTGAIICSVLNRQTIIRILTILIGLEFVSSLLLIPLSFFTVGLGFLVFLLFCSAYYWMYRTQLILNNPKWKP